MALRSLGPRGVERADRLPGVEGQPDTAQVDLDVRLAVGLGGDLETEQAVEGEAGRHVGDDDADDGRSQVHASTLDVGQDPLRPLDAGVAPDPDAGRDRALVVRHPTNVRRGADSPRS